MKFRIEYYFIILIVFVSCADVFAAASDESKGDPTPFDPACPGPSRSWNDEVSLPEGTTSSQVYVGTDVKQLTIGSMRAKPLSNPVGFPKYGKIIDLSNECVYLVPETLFRYAPILYMRDVWIECKPGEPYTIFRARFFTEPLWKTMDEAERGSASPEVLFEAYKIVSDGKEGIRQDMSKAIYFLERSAFQGYGNAQFQLYKHCDKGGGVLPNKPLAMRWLHKAAQESRHPEALSVLARKYEQGEDVPFDSEKAVEFYRMAGQLGDMWGQYRLAVLYYAGLLGVPKDMTQAIELLNQSVNNGLVEAKILLGKIYVEHPDQATSPGKGLTLLSEAALSEAAITDAEAHVVLADLYFTGKLREGATGQGLGYLRMAAGMGHQEAINVLDEYDRIIKEVDRKIVQAVYSLATYYDHTHKHRVCPKNLGEAVKLYTKVARVGITSTNRGPDSSFDLRRRAQFKLGEFYSEGWDVPGGLVPASLDTALYWFERAKENECPGAEEKIVEIQARKTEASAVGGSARSMPVEVPAPSAPPAGPVESRLVGGAATVPATAASAPERDEDERSS